MLYKLEITKKKKNYVDLSIFTLYEKLYYTKYVTLDDKTSHKGKSLDI